ncbi:NitT/TauT family transport system permease protein [Oribacterium sp. WCC10]|nr:NitT/TauT family transport system permease protein [Oribacterium sp. WCC10]
MTDFMKKIKSAEYKSIFIVLIWLFVWQLISVTVHNKVLLVGPVETVGALSKMFLTEEYRSSIAFSLMRIIGGFFLGSILGILLAWASYRVKMIEDFLEPAILVLKAVPVASFVILLLIWAGNKILAFYISMLVVLPVLYLNTLGGLKATDVKLLEMAEVFRMPSLRRIRYIYMPSVYPYLRTGLQMALGMAWKSGVAAEVIGQPLGSMGNGLYQAKIYLETAELFAWTISIIFVSFLMEKAVLIVMDKTLGRG